MAVNSIDTDKIESERPNIDVFSSVGVGVGAFGLLGLEVSLGDTVMLFVEGRVTGDVQFTNTDDEIDAENLGGGEGLAGIRLRF